MPIFICPNCGDRSISTERTAGFKDRARSCAKCGFGFVFELLDDYYPAPNAAFFLLDQEGRLIGTGRGARELTGLGDLDVIGRPVQDVLNLEFEGTRTTSARRSSGVCGSSTRRSSCTPKETDPNRRRRTSSPRTTMTAGSCSC